MMEERFKEIIEKGFDYDEALERQNIKQEGVIALRELAKNIPEVPQVVHDRHVS
jgi:hypothetical protein